MQPWIDQNKRLSACAMRLMGTVLLVAAVLAGGCGTSVSTPLPDLRPVASTSLTAEEKKKAVEELNKKRATHEQDAVRQIEQSR